MEKFICLVLAIVFVFSLSGCGSSNDEPIETESLCSNGHNYVLISNTYATCSSDGKKISKCSVCGYTKTGIYKSNGHNWVHGKCTKCRYKPLDNISYSWSLNSAGGVKLYFTFINNTQKTIKYLNFNLDLKNAVGDTAYDDITGRSWMPVEFIGPVAPSEIGKYDSNDIVGYCDRLSRATITSIWITYMDGSEEIIELNYYYEK